MVADAEPPVGRDVAVWLRVTTGLREGCTSMKFTGRSALRGAGGRRAEPLSRNLGIWTRRPAASAAAASACRSSAAAAAAVCGTALCHVAFRASSNRGARLYGKFKIRRRSSALGNCGETSAPASSSCTAGHSTCSGPSKPALRTTSLQSCSTSTRRIASPCRRILSVGVTRQPRPAGLTRLSSRRSLW